MSDETGWVGLRGVPNHGTRGRYARGCRCDECRAYNARVSAHYRSLYRRPGAKKTRSDKGIKKGPQVPLVHGTSSGYRSHQCRCDECRRWAADYNRQWRQRRDNHSRQYMRAYHHARRSAQAPATPESREYIAIISTDPCVYCGAPAEHIDHITPVAVGGDSSWSNSAPTCRTCNISKGAKSLLRYLLYRKQIAA